ncbi:hypothetical protein [Thermogymnomonas acidicola]|uniref:hypothetical protein n=1 Tax=Thermogymnomonas acidicola TaxID=399579 RepID=UPI001396B778|nr:hypothetical protein [Thermogymnomonas acidicola]
MAILAIDASSPFSGGTLLGNRIRMQPVLAKSGGVYMRSLANRGGSTVGWPGRPGHLIHTGRGWKRLHHNRDRRCRPG